MSACSIIDETIDVLDIVDVMSASGEYVLQRVGHAVVPSAQSMAFSIGSIDRIAVLATIGVGVAMPVFGTALIAGFA
jgi:hypothetical protein